MTSEKNTYQLVNMPPDNSGADMDISLLSVFFSIVLCLRNHAFVFLAVIMLLFPFRAHRAMAIDPVTVIVSLPPPYSPFLHEYASLTSNKLQVTIIVNDSRIENFPARLQMIVERVNAGVIMQTHQYASAPPIVLNGFATEILQGADLAPYFLAANNTFTGFPQSQYIQSGRIPDGFYRIGFRVVHANRPEVIISNTAYSMPGWFLLNDPPQLNLPINQSKEDLNDPQTVKLQWFPRHLGSMNSAFATTYRVELFPIRMPGINPNQLVLMMQPEFADETNQTSYYLTPDKYMLEPGVEYAWRVKALSAANEEMTLFQNKGYSEVFSFTYGKPCPDPMNVAANVQGSEKVLITWDNDPQHSGVDLRFRLSGEQNATWHSLQSIENSIEISGLLSAGKTYDYQLRANCFMKTGEYSRTRTFTTRQEVMKDFECGLPDQLFVTNRTPKSILRAGDIIYSGKFPVVLTEVKGSNGDFTGKGSMRVPFLAYIQIKVEFSKIKVNELNQVFEGEIKSVYNSASKFLLNVPMRDVVGEVITGKPAIAVSLGYEVTNISQLRVEVRDDNTVVITKPDGSTMVYQVNNPAAGFTIQDSAGNIYHVGEQGNITRAGKQHTPYNPDSYARLAQSYNMLDPENRVEFKNHENCPWAFDAWNEKYSKDTGLDTIYKNLYGYRVTFKLVPPGKTATLEARISKGNIDPNKVVFRTPAGVEYASEFKNNTYQIKVSSGLKNDGQELYALYPYTDTSYKSMGKVIIVTYDLKKLDAVIVPVGDVKFNFGKLKENLNKIYGPVGIEWDVNTDLVLTNGNLDLKQFDTLNTKESENFSMYSPEMSALNSLYKKEGKVDSKTMFLFVVKTIEGKSGILLGDMPLSGQFGYLAASNDEKLAAKTIAHELGHGMFYLRHTFSQYNLAEGDTDNLMDYSSGTRLFKKQWDEIFDPRRPRFAWRQDEEEGAMGTLFVSHVLEIIDKIRQGNKSKKKEIPIQITTGIGVFNKITIGSKDYSYIQMKTIGFNPLSDKLPATTIQTTSGPVIIQGERPSFNIQPSELTKTLFTENQTRYMKYQFHELQTKQNSAPNADTKVPTGTNRIEISVKENENIAFENYLYGRDMPKPGDPLINMSIVHNNSAPNSGGMFGCARVGSGCDQSTIPNMPKYDDKKKIHDGVDLFAFLNTDVFSMYDGEIVIVENSVSQNEEGTQGALGNRILVKHTPTQHGKNSNTIYVMYGHLNVVESTIQVGIKVKQGQKIGESGKTGNASDIDAWRYHVHLMVYENGTSSENKTDPRTYLTTKFDNNGNKIE